MILPHLAGTLDPGRRQWSAIKVTQFGSEDVTLPGADVHYALVEAPLQEVLAQLPPGLHPAIPGVLGLTFVKCPDGPLGPFQMAVVGVACRSGIRPRYMTVAAFANTERSAQELRMRWGFPIVLADVQTLVYYDQVISTVRLDSRTALQVTTGNLITLTGPGASVIYCPALNMVDLDEHHLFAQVDLSAEFKRVARGEPTVHVFDNRSLGNVNCTPTDPVSGTAVRADLKLHAVRYVLDPSISAEQGGGRKLP